MNGAYAGAAGILALAALAYGGFSPGQAVDPSVTGAIVDASARGEKSFTLISNWDDAGCAVAVGAALEGARRPLRLAPGCVEANPALAGARYWVERADGDVAFSRRDGRVVAEFVIGDGAAFESYSPPQPIMILLAAD